MSLFSPNFMRKIHLQIIGDTFLLNRMLTNLIRNSFIHNPNGCQLLSPLIKIQIFGIFFLLKILGPMELIYYTLEHLNKNGFIRIPIIQNMD